MAIVTTKSGVITNRDATPKTLNNGAISGGMMKGFAGTVEAVSGDSIGSVYIMGSIPSNARVHQLLAVCDAITTCAADIGLYETTANGGAVVDADFFASAQSLASALTGTDVTHESGVYDQSKVEMPLWQALGLTADPCKMYDVAYTLTAAAGSAGTVSLKGTYSA